MIMRYIIFGLSMILSFVITSSLDLTYETKDLEEHEYDPLNLLHIREFQNDPAVERIKRGTTIVHRLRRKRPKPYRRIRRPPKRIFKPRPVYGPPQIHIHTPSFAGPSGPSYHHGPYPSNFAEPPTAPSAPSAPASSVPFEPNHNNPSITQFQSQLNTQYVPPPPQPPPNQYYPQGPPIFQPSSGNFQQSSQPVFNPPAPAAPSAAPPSDPTFTASSIPSSPASSPAIPSSVPSSVQPSITSISNPPSRLRPVTTFNSQNSRPAVNTVEIPTQSIPLENINQGDPYRNTISSYDVPVNSFTISEPSKNNVFSSRPQSTINFNPPKGLPSSDYDIFQGFSPSLPSPPILPTRYDTNDFPSINSKLPDNRFNNYNKAVFDDSSFENFLNDVSESKRVTVRTRPKSKSKISKGKSSSKSKTKPKSKVQPVSTENSSYFDDEDDEGDDYDFSFEQYAKKRSTTTTTTTTKRPKTRRRKKPKVSTTTQHNLDIDDFKDAFDSASEIQEYIITPDENSDFESKKFYKVSKTPIVTKSSYVPKITTTKQPTTNYVLISSQNDFEDNKPVYITKHVKTEKPLITVPPFTYRPRHILKTTPKQTIYQQSPVVESDSDIKILSVQKSNSHSYYAGSEKENYGNQFDVGYHYPDTDDYDSFSTGVFLSNNGFGTRIKHGRNKKDLDNEEGYVFETEYEIEFPTNHQYFKK